jgi:hypothetical protein
MEPNPGEKEAATEWQETPNEEVAIDSLRACQNGKTAYQEVTEANSEKMDPIDRAIAILEKMEDTSLKANTEEMESELEHWEVPKEDGIVKPVKGRKKRHWDRHLAAGRCGEPRN